MKDKKISALPVGGASLIMAFMLLCLTVMGTVSYMYAKRDCALSLRTAESISEYYAADSICEKTLMEIDKDIKSGLKSENILEKYSGYAIEAVFDGGDITASYRVPVQNHMVISVTVEFSEGKPKITKWAWENSLESGDSGSTEIMDIPVF